MIQITQTAACYRHHLIEQQLARFLLLTQDRREGITEAAGNLQRAGCIRYRRGHIAVVDRDVLKTHACECYAVVRDELARLRVANSGVSESEAVIG